MTLPPSDPIFQLSGETEDFQFSAGDARAVDEAIARGADFTITTQMLGARYAPPAESESDYFTPGIDAARAANTRRAFLQPTIQKFVREAFQRYEQRVRQEFGELSAIVRRSFGEIKGADPEVVFQAYLSMRARYYRAGWRCPKQQIFDWIVTPDHGAKLLGQPIEGGIHTAMVEVLRLAELELARDGEFDAKRAPLFRIGGFVPRDIADSNVLSNHAFGLAIDIDPAWNPQFKSPAVIAALQHASGLDFGKSLYAASSARRVDEFTRRMEQASETLQRWLVRVFPEYDAARKELKTYAATRDAFKRGTAEWSRADRELTELKARFAANKDLNALQVLIDNYSEPTVRGWADYGIQTIPRTLIEKFTAKGAAFGARWGGEYETSKDVMHLELIAARVIPRNGQATVGVKDLEGAVLPSAPACSRK